MKKLLLFSVIFTSLLFPQLVNDALAVTINSNPSGAEIFIGGVSKGKTEKTLYLYPGNYDIQIFRSGYNMIIEKIVVGTDEKLNSFSYNLVRNSGQLKIDITPPTAIIKINKEAINAEEVQELTPGIYQIEAEATTYYPYKGTVEIVHGETKEEKIVLRQKSGKLQFAINPSVAECVLSQDGVEKYRWIGLKIFNPIAEGTYDLTAKATGHRTYTDSIVIKGNLTTIEDIQMVEGNDPPDWMVFVEGGTFTMGSNDGGKNEKPPHRVTVNSFMIGKYEVTQTLWESVMGSNPSGDKGSNKPVENVSWYDVIEFCNKMSEKEGLTNAYKMDKKRKDPNNSDKKDNKKWLVTCDFNSNGYRLPTEAEWEYAAKGGNKSKEYSYSGSNDLNEVGWYWGNSEIGCNKVGTKQPNELGIYDMSGNLMEWCWDFIYGSNHVVRGGSWNATEGLCRVAYRGSFAPGLGYSWLGLRLVRSK